MQILFDESEPVSYTHLDVYKRQAADRAVVIVTDEQSWFVGAVGMAAELAGKPCDVLQIKKPR